MTKALGPGCICGGNLSVEKEKLTIPLLECPDCGTYRLREIHPSIFKQYTSGQYHAHAPIPYEERFRHDKDVGKQRLEKLGRRLPLKTKTSILDVGCANGGFVAACLDAGHKMVGGVDLSIKSAPAELKGYLTEQKFPSTFDRRSWDVITLHDVLEHVENPKDLIDKCTAILKREGTLVIDIPDMSSPYSEHHFKPAEHIWYFTPEGLKLLLKRCHLRTYDVDLPIRGKAVLYSVYEPAKQEVVIIGPPGVGDLMWVLSKVEDIRRREAPCTVTFQVPISGAASFHTIDKRSDTFLKMVPFIDRVQFPVMGHPEFSDDGVRDVTQPVYRLCANYHMESGKRIESWHPEYKTHIDFDLNISDRNLAWAEAMWGEVALDEKPRIAVYFSSDRWNQACTNSTREWSPAHWIDVCQHLTETYGCKLMVLGAEWDRSYTDSVLSMLDPESYVDLVGETDLPQCAAIFRKADLMLGLCCGLTMLSVHVKCPTVMMWPGPNGPSNGVRFMKGFQTAWCLEEALGNWYKPLTVQEISTLDVIDTADTLLAGRLESGNGNKLGNTKTP